jgi:hypothetical protein
MRAAAESLGISADDVPGVLFGEHLEAVLGRCLSAGLKLEDPLAREQPPAALFRGRCGEK